MEETPGKQPTGKWTAARQSTNKQSTEKLPHVVVLGGGFGGLRFCRHFKSRARVTLIDKHNHHLFQPLLYQVATAGLTAPEIASPLRTIFSGRRNLTVLMDTVEGVDLAERCVYLTRDRISYDYLVIAMGGVTSYFGHKEWRDLAPGLKSIDDAHEIRRKILSSFEQAENTHDDEERAKLMTLVVVGGGPTGVELAGALAELTRQVFRRDFRRIDPSHSRIILVDGGSRLLGAYPPDLSEKARQQLVGMGVQVMLDTQVTDVAEDHVKLSTGRRIETRNTLWGAGVVAHPIARTLNVETGHGGRIKVHPDLSMPGHREVFAVGDIAAAFNKDGSAVPGVAQAAMQMGKHIAGVIEHEIEGGEAVEPEGERQRFHYWDKGAMATIGRLRGVARLGDLPPGIPFLRGVKFSGWPAWLSWLTVHLFFLIGFHNRLSVLAGWFYSYVSFHRGARIIFGRTPGPPPPHATHDAHDTHEAHETTKKQRQEQGKQEDAANKDSRRPASS